MASLKKKRKHAKKVKKARILKDLEKKLEAGTSTSQTENQVQVDLYDRVEASTVKTFHMCGIHYICPEIDSKVEDCIAGVRVEMAQNVIAAVTRILAQVLLFFLNIAIMCFGVEMSVIPSTIRNSLINHNFNHSHLDGEHEAFISYLEPAPTGFLLYGVFTIVFSVFGCMTAILRGKIRVMSLSLAAVLLILSEVIGSIVVGSKIKTKLMESMEKYSDKDWKKKLLKNKDTLIWSLLQVWLGCCGIDGPKDWETTKGWKKQNQLAHRRVPLTCCKPEYKTCVIGAYKGTYFNTGCAHHQSVLSIESTLLTLIVLQVFQIVFSLLLEVMKYKFLKVKYSDSCDDSDEIVIPVYIAGKSAEANSSNLLAVAHSPNVENASRRSRATISRTSDGGIAMVELNEQRAAEEKQPEMVIKPTVAKSEQADNTQSLPSQPEELPAFPDCFLC